MSFKQPVTKVNASNLGAEPNLGVKGMRLRARTELDAIKISENPQGTTADAKSGDIVKQIWGSEDDAELARKHENWQRARAKQQWEINRTVSIQDVAKVAFLVFVVRAILHRFGLSVRKVTSLMLVAGLIRAFFKLRAPARTFSSTKDTMEYTAWPFFGQIGLIAEFLNKGGPIFQVELGRANDFCSEELVLFASPREFSLMDPRDREHVLKTNWKNYVKNGPEGNGFQEVFAEVMGRGIFAVDGEEWQDHRKVASHLFSANGLKSKMEKSFTAHGDKLVKLLEPIARSGATIDFQEAMQNLTFETICDIAFGVEPGALDSGLTGGKKIDFLVQFDRAQQLSTMRFIFPGPVWKTMRFFNIGGERVLREDAIALSNYVRDIIHKRRATGDFEKADDLLAMYVRTGKSSGKAYMTDDEYLVDAVLNFILAGRDTTGCTLTNVFKLLQTNKEAERRMLEELDTVVGRGNAVTWDHVRELRYCGAVFNETLRMYPPVSGDPRAAMEDDILPSGLRVEAGQRVTIWNSAIGRDHHLWDKPDDFMPERWLQEGKPTRRPDEFIFPVFWAGPRLCLGKDMARLETIAIAYAILSKFHVEVLPHSEKPINSTVQFYEAGLPAKIHMRA